MKPLITSPTFFIGKEANDLISFGSGQPDLPPPDAVFSILPHYHDFKYGLIQGQTNLRTALAKEYPNASADNFVITNGASEALDLSFRFLAQKGEKILLPRPYYYSYPYNAKYVGLETKFYDLVNGKINLDNFAENLEGCIAVLINSPSNPTGTVQDVDTLRQVEKLAQARGVYVISDEVYKDLIFDRENYLIRGDDVITVNSFSKTYAMCGFRVGYLYATNPEILRYARNVKTHTSMNTNILGQEMAYEATKVPRDYLEKQVAIWQGRRDLIYQGLLELGLELNKPEGAFYVFPKMQNSNKVVNDLYYDYNMVTYDGSWFGFPDHVRFSYALDVEKIKEGLSRLKQYLAKNPV